MAATIIKNIGAPHNISNVQKTRKIVSVAMVIDDNGLYSVIISYVETDTDGSAVVVATTNGAKTILDAVLNAAAKSEIDSVYTRALNVL